MTYAHTDLFVNQAINAIVPKDSYDNEYIFYNVRCSVLPQLKSWIRALLQEERIFLKLLFQVFVFL